MSDTPRTDALSRHTPYDEIARTLERELAAVTRERDDAYANVEDADRELKALRAEVERIRAAIKGQASLLPLLPTAPPGSYARGYDSGMRDTITAISAALQEPTP